MAPKVAEKAVKAPATKAPAAKKVVKKATAGASKKKVKAVESYKIYIYKVLKQVGLISLGDKQSHNNAQTKAKKSCTNDLYQ